MSDVVSPTDWMKGISLSVLASFIGAASKLALRKSWLLLRDSDRPSIVDAVDGQATDTENSLSRTDRDRRADEERARRRRVRRASACVSYSGMVGMSFLNPLCSVLAMRYASPSILAPFSGLTLVWVILFSYPAIGETPSPMQVTAASLIVLGEVVVAVFGDHTNNDDITVRQMRDRYLDTDFLAYCIVVTLYMLLMAYWATSSKRHVLRKFAWGTSAGAVTGFQNFLKDALTLSSLKQNGRTDELPWFFGLFVVLAIATAFGGLLLLNQCMKRYDATYSAATFVGSFVVSASIMSAIHYDTMQNLQGLANYVMYPSGLLVLMIGVLMLVKENSGALHTVVPLQDPDEERDGDDNDDDVGVDNSDAFTNGLALPVPKKRADTDDSQTPFFYRRAEPASAEQPSVV